MVRELHLGGAERDLTRLAIGLDRSRFEPHVVCFRSEGVRGEELRAAGVPILELPVTSFKNRTAIQGAWMLRDYMRERGVRVFQGLDGPGVIFGTPVAKWAGVDAIFPCQLGHRELYPRMERALFRVSDRLADRLIVNCQALIDDLVRKGWIEREKAALIYNGVDVDAYRPGDPATRREVLPEGLRDSSVVIGALSALRPEKDVGTLIEAFARVAPRFPDARLAIVGGGPEQASLESLAAERDVGDRCHFVGYTSRVAEWLAAMDVYVLSSLSESFPNSLLEAMSCGVCSAASKVGGVPEMLSEGQTGVLFPPGDAEALADRLVLLLSDEALRARLGAAARAFVCSELRVDRFIENTQNLYDSVLSAS